MNEELLKKRIADAAKALTLVEKDKRDAEMVALQAVEEQFRQRLLDARNAKAVADKALRDFTDQTSSHPWDGKKVFRVRPTYARFRSRQTGEERLEGIVEVVRQSSQFASNLSEWSTPALGSVIVRKIKADGKPSLQFHTARLNEQWSLVE